MSVDISAFFDPDRGEAVKVETPGDTVVGTIVDVELVDDQHNAGKSVLKIKISVDDVVKDLYVRSPGQKDAIGKAVLDAGSKAIDVGGQLAITYTGDKTLQRTGRSMKLYSARYKVPQPVAVTSFDEAGF